MKVCIISVFLDGTGYSHAAINTALSLNSIGIDVCCRNISLTGKRNYSYKEKSLIESFLNKDANNVDAIIQVCLPHTFQKHTNVKSIGYFAWETTNFIKSKWADRLNTMDQIWSMCLQQKKSCDDSFVSKQSKIIPIGCNKDRFDNISETTKILSDKFKSNLNNHCTFYCIAENNRRKNYPSLLRAYYMAFDKSDNVKLVIKSSPGSSDDFNKTISEIKQSIHIHDNPDNYPPVIIIDQYLNQEQIDAIHLSCNYFITCSKGESWCIPAHDALGFGNKIIAPNWGSFPDLIHGQQEYFQKDKLIWRNPGQLKTGWLFNGQLSPCFGMNDINFLYSGRELWFEPDIVDVARCMKNAYKEFNSGDTIEAKNQNESYKRAMEFTFEKVGQIIKGAINE